MTDLLLFLVIGAVIGGVATKVMHGGGFGVVGNIFLGMLGSWAGSKALIWLDMNDYGMEGQLLSAAAGAIVVCGLIGLFMRG